MTNKRVKTLKSSRIYTVFILLVSFGLIAAFIYYIYSNVDKYKDLLNFSAAGLLSMFLISLAFPVISGVSNVHLFRGMGADISYLDAFFLTAASTLANQLPISGGIVSKGFYLKRRHDISYVKSFSSTIALSFCFLSVNGMIGVFILFYSSIFKNFHISPVLLIGFSAMAACLLVFWLPLERVNFPEKIHAWIHQVAEGWLLFNRKPVLLVKLISLQVGLTLLLSLRYWLAFRMLSQNIPFEWAILFSTASILTQLVSIAPGGLGVREAIVSAVASTLGFDAGTSIVAVGLDRLISTSVVFIVGGISVMILSKQISGDSPEPSDQGSDYSL